MLRLKQQKTQMLKIKKTKRLFYNKFGYKISLEIEGASYFRVFGVTDEFMINSPTYRWEREALINETAISDLCYTLVNYDKDSWKIRVERNIMDVYSSDRRIIEDIKNKFPEKIYHIFEPSETMSRDKNIIHCKKLPHDRYAYKVFLLPHKIKDKQKKRNFIDWIKNNDNFLISDSVANWFYITEWNWDRRYMWANTPENLLMLKLRQSEAIGTIHEYRVIDK